MEQENIKTDLERQDMHPAQEESRVKPRDFEKYPPGSLSFSEVNGWVLSYAGPDHPNYFKSCLIHSKAGKGN